MMLNAVLDFIIVLGIVIFTVSVMELISVMCGASEDEIG